jgi:hypothetical protein
MPQQAQFDVNAARQSGATDDQILSYLSQRSPNFDVQGALKQAPKADVINYLSVHASPPDTSEGSSSAQPSAAMRFGSNYLSGLGVMDKESGKRFFTHPLDTAKGMLTTNRDLGDQAYEELGRGDYGAGLSDLIYSAIPFAGPTLSRSGHQLAQGDYAGGLGTMSGVGTSVAAGKVLAPEVTMAKSPAQLTRGMVRNGTAPGMLSGRMQETPPGEAFTRGEVQNYARGQGVNLDLADATGNGVARGVKGVAERSLGGRGVMRRNADSNFRAIQGAAENELSQYAPEGSDPAALGTAVQQQLQQNLASLKTQASEQFSELDQAVGGNRVDVRPTIQATAQKIVGDNLNYYEAHPELVPKQAWKIVENLANGDESRMKWSDLHQLRTDLMDVYRNNPDIIKSRSDAWIQQLVGKTDEAMNSASAGLSQGQKAQFRAANQTWEQIKSTYDNPQHPFYAATRAQMPSQVPGMLQNKTPELAAQVQTVLGPLKGQFQRAYVNKLLDPKGTGTYDFAGLNARLKGVSQPFLEQTLGKQGARNIRLLGQTAKTVTANMNPSGTSDVAVPAAEIAGLATHPLATVPEIAANYGAARGLTSAKLVNRLTRPGGPKMRAGTKLPVSVPLAAQLAQNPEVQDWRNQYKTYRQIKAKERVQTERK